MGHEAPAQIAIGDEAQEPLGLVDDAGAAHAAVWIGGFGCLIGLRTFWAVLPAVLGIACGIWGMRTRRRDLATTGLAVSVLALFLGFAQFGYDLWTKHQSQQLIYELQDQPF